MSVVVVFFTNLGLIQSQPPLTTCPFTPNGNSSQAQYPNPYIEATSIAGYERYFARAMHMERLASLYHETNLPDRCTDYQNSINMLAELNASFVGNVTDYYGTEWDWAASDEDRFDVTGFNFITSKINAFRQIPKDINLAYDKRGLRRPILDAFVEESIDRLWRNSVSPFDPQPTKMGPTYIRPIETIKIPASVISAFADEMNDPDDQTSAKTYYFSGTTPKSIGFKFDRVTWQMELNPNSPVFCNDVTKIEGRMWIYFLCKQFIDMGYTSINLSQSNLFFDHKYGTADAVAINIDTEFDSKLTQSQKEGIAKYYNKTTFNGYFNLNRVATKIREYARSKGKFILLTNQSDRIYFAYNRTGTFPQFTFVKTNKYIFDINTAAMRPLEVTPTSTHVGDGRNMAQGATKPQMFTNSFDELMPNCASSCIKATIDPGSGTNYERNASGFSPRPWSNELPNDMPSGRYFNKQPTVVGLDGGSGRELPYPNNAYVRCAPYSVQLFENGNYVKKNESSTLTPHGTQNGGTWGFDDARWWYEFGTDPNLSSTQNDNCLFDWLNYQYQNVKTFDNSNHTYYLIIPGRQLARKRIANGDVTDNDSVFRLWEHTTLKNAIRDNLWKVNEVNSNSINVSYNPSEGNADGYCYKDQCPGTVTYGKYYLSVNNIDKSSIYTWHIQWSDGTWEPFTYGSSREFSPTRVGSFSVALRQDNLGLPANYFGAKGVSVDLFSQEECTTNNNGCNGGPIEIKVGNPTMQLIKAKELTKSEMKNLEIIADERREISKQGLSHNKNNNRFYNNNKQFETQIFPQPTTDDLTISTKLFGSGKINIALFSSLGAKVLEVNNDSNSGLNTQTIDTSRLPSGLYLLKVTFNNEVQTFKVTKI